MRMWMVDPSKMCKNHLLGEHNELHKHLPRWLKKSSITGYIRSNAIEPMAYLARHEELALEMLMRGYKHKSPLISPNWLYLSKKHLNFKVDIKKSEKMLKDRCKICSKNYC